MCYSTVRMSNVRLGVVYIDYVMGDDYGLTSPLLNKSVITERENMDLSLLVKVETTETVSFPLELVNGVSRNHCAQGPRQRQGPLSRTSPSNHLRGLPVVHKLQNARQHRVPTRTRRLIPRGQTYTIGPKFDY